MSGPRWSILIFLACVAAVLAGLASLTFYTLGLERRDYQARADARHQETTRLVLWRMDSALTPLLTREASRPFFEYEPFVPADLGYGRIPGPIQPGQTLVPSPLLRPEEPLVKLYFTRSLRGLVTSPQAPPRPLREIAESVYMSSYEIEVAEQRVRALSELLGLGPSSVPGRAPAPLVAAGGDESGSALVDGARPAPGESVKLEQNEVTQSANEYRARQQIAENVSQNRVPQVAGGPDVSRRAETPAEIAAKARPLGASQAPAAVADKAKVGEEAAVSEAQPAAPVGDGSSGGAGTAPEASKSEVKPEAGRWDSDGAAAGASVPAPPAAPGVSGPSGDAAPKGRAERGEPKAGSPPAAGEGEKLEAGATAMSGANYGRGSGSPGGTGEVFNDGIPERFSNLLALAPMGPAVEVGRLTPRWVTVGKGRDPELVFLREVVVEGERLEQGFWVDWPALRDMLVASAGDLTPGATLRPLLAGVDESDPALLARTLAGIPAELLTGDAPAAQVPVWSPARMTLLVTWIVSLLAILAIAMVLRASMELAERRGRFVSAVTHELRTPLTTFCLYSQMLADGLIQGDEARTTYLQTLKSESQRLARIVESVLEYARLGRKRPGQVRTLQSVERLIEQVTPPLEQRCRQAGMTLEVGIEGGPSAAGAMVAADAPTIERILYNLVDNACKYASAGADQRVHVVATVDGSGLVLSVRDHGPGIEPSERPRVFRAFVRGTREAAGTIPGLGLGLSLAQGLAREIGAELRLEPAREGARFDLRLPLA